VVLTPERRAFLCLGAYVVDSYDSMMVELAQDWVLRYIMKRSDAAVGNLTLADIYVAASAVAGRKCRARREAAALREPEEFSVW